MKPARKKPATLPTVFAAATRGGKVLPSWPEKGTGRTAPLATCGHCGGKPLIIRVCGFEPQSHAERRAGRPQRPRYCAVCDQCGAHRAVQAKGGGHGESM